MKKQANRKAADDFQSSLDAETIRRLERLVTANNFLSVWHEKYLGKALELEISKPWMKKHVEVVNRLGELIKKGAEGERKGSLSGREYWATEVLPLWNKSFTDKTHARIADLHARHALPASGYEHEYIAGILGLDNANRLTFLARHIKTGVSRFWQDESTPQEEDEDTGVVRQELNPPFMRCAPPPFSMGGASKADSGPAINVSSAGVATVDGSGFVSAMTFAPILMGGGSAATGILGISSDFPSGFARLKASATVDVSYSGRAFSILGGATASINLVITVQLPDGRQVSAVRLLDAIPTAVFLPRSVSTVLRNQVIELVGIDLQGVAGPVRVFAGVQVFSAGVGIGGSSGARMDAGFVVKQICVSLE
jgi:hypothetical protein